MVFSSYAFLLVFLPLTLAAFFGLRRCGLRAASVTLLLVASLVFYGVWSVQHLALLCASIAGNYAVGLYLSAEQRGPQRKAALIGGIAADLGLLVWFKYLDFIGSNVSVLTGADWTLRHLILPLGISFYTFTQIAYLVDCWRDRGGERRLKTYALFVTFFPHLIAGPIIHHRYVRPQLDALGSRAIDPEWVARGLMIFAMGLAKKTLIADPIGRAIDPIWAAAAAGDAIGAAAAWTAMLGYTLQIYFDFSGYSDMAIGLGLMVGVKLPVNFNSPYRAKSIIEFWRRWHMTLSAFLRDYVYIPLGGNRGSDLFRLRNIFLTMLIGGVWHGAAWTFVIWGAIHASLITLNHAARLWLPALDRWSGPIADFAKRAALLAAVMLAWVYFRADGLDAAHAVLAGLATPAGGYAPDPYIVALMIFTAGLALFAPNALQVAGYNEAPDKPFAETSGARLMRPTPIAATATAIMLAAGVAVAWRPAVFIYFNF